MSSKAITTAKFFSIIFLILCVKQSAVQGTDSLESESSRAGASNALRIHITDLSNEVLNHIISFVVNNVNEVNNVKPLRLVNRHFNICTLYSDLYKILLNVPKHFIGDIDVKSQSLFKINEIAINLLNTQKNEIRSLMSLGHRISRFLDQEVNQRTLSLKIINQFVEINSEELNELTFYQKIRSFQTLDEKLNNINFDIINLLLKSFTSYEENVSRRIESGDYVMILQQIFNIDLRGKITRLPVKAIDAIKAKIELLHPETYITLDLSNNFLTWLPDELFNIRGIKELNLRNNLFKAMLLPDSEFNKSIEKIDIGNFGVSFFNFMFDYNAGKRTLGNYFETIPESIFELPNLRVLYCESVGLKEMSEQKIIEKFRYLTHLFIGHNNLTQRPNFDIQERHFIHVQAGGNPCYPTLASNFKNWFNAYRTNFVAPICEEIQQIMLFPYHHPYISTSIGVALSSYIYRQYEPQ